MIAPSPILIWAVLTLAVVTVSPTLTGEPLAAGRSLPAPTTRTSPATNWKTPAVLASAWPAAETHAERMNRFVSRLALAMGPPRPELPQFSPSEHAPTSLIGTGMPNPTARDVPFYRSRVPLSGNRAAASVFP